MPFIIDPSAQAGPFLAAHLRRPPRDRDAGGRAVSTASSGAGSGGAAAPAPARAAVVEVIKHHDPRFLNALELAVRFGKTLIVEARCAIACSRPRP